MTQTGTINILRQQIDQLGAQLQHQQATNQYTHPVPQAHPFQDATLPSPPLQYHYNHHAPPTNNSLVEVMDVLNRSMTLSTSKEHYLNNAQSCDGKDPKEFGMWLDEVSRLDTICDKNPMEVAFAISKGTFHKYINELVSRA